MAILALPLSLQACPSVINWPVFSLTLWAAPASQSGFPIQLYQRLPISTFNAVEQIMKNDKIIKKALKVLEKKMSYGDRSHQFTSPTVVKQYARLSMVEHHQEVFAVMFLDNRHCLISFEKMFFGTINQASVYPREVAKLGLEKNAAAVILMHNHPSGNPEPSQADIQITRRIQQSLELFDIRVLDHLIVGREITSMAETGLIWSRIAPPLWAVFLFVHLDLLPIPENHG